MKFVSLITLNLLLLLPLVLSTRRSKPDNSKVWELVQPFGQRKLDYDRVLADEEYGPQLRALAANTKLPRWPRRSRMNEFVNIALAEMWAKGR